MDVPALPRPRGVSAYSRVPSFRFPTPPRAEVDGLSPEEASNWRELASCEPGSLEKWRTEAGRSIFSRAAGSEPQPPATFALPHLDLRAKMKGYGSAPTVTPPVVEPQLPPSEVSLEVATDDPPPTSIKDNLDVTGTTDLEKSLEEIPVEAPATSSEEAGSGAVMPISAEVSTYLQQAYDGEDDQQAGAGFRWSGVVDAAHAAWIGGTRLLRYGEVLPGGVSKAVAWLVTGGLAPEAASTADVANRQLCLELGMGRGRLALQLFLSGATVIGVELANERYKLAVAAFERLVHRSPENFEISKRTAESIRIRRRGGPKGSICEARLGNFFDVVTASEVNAATIIFCQVCLPPPTWPRVRTLCSNTSSGCRLLTYEDMARIWRGETPAASPNPFPFDCLGTPRLACTWAPQKGHRFYVYERVDSSPYSPEESEDELEQSYNLGQKERRRHRRGRD